MDSPLEGSGFEPSVPPSGGQRFSRLPQLRRPRFVADSLLRKATRRRASLMLMRRIVLADHNL